MKRIILCIAVFLCLSSMSAFAEQDVKKTYKGFQLFTKCEPIYLLVEQLPSDALKIGLSKGAIESAVESRLRAARIYSDKSLDSYLSVKVNVVGQAFDIDIEFNKTVFDIFTGGSTYAITWKDGGIGRTSNSEYILSALASLMDEFLVEFLRVNDEACRKKHKDAK